MSGYGEARPIGRMVPHTHQQPPPAPAACARCACKLSRYRGHAEGAYCSPCKATIKAEAEQRVESATPFKRNPQHKSSALTAQSSAIARHEHAHKRQCACGNQLHRDTKGTKCRACYGQSAPKDKLTRNCVDCEKPIKTKNKSGYCKACLTWNTRATLQKKPVCPDCGGWKKPGAARCFKCAMIARRHPDRDCPVCGARKGRKESEMCRSCRDARGGSHKAAELRRAA